MWGADELPSPEYVFTIFSAGAILSSQNGRGTFKVTFSFQHLKVLEGRPSEHNIDQCGWIFVITKALLSGHIRMNDIDELVHHQIQQLLLCFTSQTCVVTFIQSAMNFQLEPWWSAASKCRLVVLIARFNTEKLMSLVEFDTASFNQFTSVLILLCSLYRTNHQPNQVKRLALFHSGSPWRQPGTPSWILLLFGVPLVYLFYFTQFFTKAS